MLKRLRLGPQALMVIEAALLGLFFVQALRFLIGMLYTRTAGASLVTALAAIGVQPLADSAPTPAQVNAEIAFTIAVLALPLLALVLIRFHALILVPVALMVVGRALLNSPAGISSTQAAALVVGGGLMYLAFLARWRANLVPFFFVLGLTGDQLIRAAGNTIDPSWSASYAPVQVALSIGVALVALIAFMWDRRTPPAPLPNPRAGLIPFWGGLGIGGLLFIQLALLSLPNAVAARARYDYTLLVPLLLIATLLPVIPGVRGIVRSFLNNFDGGVRGWLWMLMAMLLVVLGTRLSGLLAALALLMAQFVITLMWWWVVKPLAERDRSFSGLWLVLAAAVFGLLVAGDLFTYEAPYVREIGGDLAFLNSIIPPLLRGFNNMGLAILILSVFLAALPMTQTRRRIPWVGGSRALSLAASALLIAAALGGWLLARPPTIQAASGETTLRVGTYNIHGGTDEFFTPSLNAIADTILRSGANTVLMQEVEAGRLTSFGVDQSLWLARRVGMDRRFYPTVEGLRGLAVLSNVPIAYDDGTPLPGRGEATGLQRVQITPDADTVITVYNTWLAYLQEPTGDLTIEAQESEQQSQLDALFSIIGSQHPNGVLGRTVLGGTFNNVPDSDLLAQVRAAGFTDSFAGLPIELSATLVRQGLQPARIDFVLLRNLSPAEGVLVLNSAASDHRLAVTGIDLTP
ncbi:MAG TPA: endonuclease/exonuclease/phosphatase family protein [Candidatus Limnocylindrales bacterium]|nr:endonuclease/exonuclease/phosphatase family protein [Candidatus Limnocylindrales bacterium]